MDDSSPRNSTVCEEKKSESGAEQGQLITTIRNPFSDDPPEQERQDSTSELAGGEQELSKRSGSIEEKSGARFGDLAHKLLKTGAFSELGKQHFKKRIDQKEA